MLLLFAVLVGVLLVRDTRWQLRTAYPWIGGVIALLLWLPNLIWQFQNGWPALALGADIADELAASPVGWAAFATLAMFSPVIAVVWLYGLVQLFRDSAWTRFRPIGVAFLVSTAVFVLAAGKGYYLAGAIVPLVGAGCTALAARWSHRRLIVAGAVFALSAASPGLRSCRFCRPAVRGIVLPAMDSDQLETIGWPEYVAR